MTRAGMRTANAMRICSGLKGTGRIAIAGSWVSIAGYTGVHAINSFTESSSRTASTCQSSGLVGTASLRLYHHLVNGEYRR